MEPRPPSRRDRIEHTPDEMCRAMWLDLSRRRAISAVVTAGFRWPPLSPAVMYAKQVIPSPKAIEISNSEPSGPEGWVQYVLCAMTHMTHNVGKDQQKRGGWGLQEVTCGCYGGWGVQGGWLRRYTHTALA